MTRQFEVHFFCTSRIRMECVSVLEMFLGQVYSFQKKPKTPEEQEGDHFPPLEVNAVHAWHRLDEANSMSLPKL